METIDLIADVMMDFKRHNDEQHRQISDKLDEIQKAQDSLRTKVAAIGAVSGLITTVSVSLLLHFIQH